MSTIENEKRICLFQKCLFQKKNSRRCMMIQKLKGEVDEWEKKYESALKDICRLETKVHSHQLDYKSESEILRVEVKKRDEQSAQKMKDETLVFLETHLDESQQKVKELSAKVARLDEQHRITLGEAAALKKANDEYAFFFLPFYLSNLLFYFKLHVNQSQTKSEMVVQLRSSQERLEAKLHDLKNKVRESFFLQNI